jgi:hypothetical protein
VIYVVYGVWACDYGTPLVAEVGALLEGLGWGGRSEGNGGSCRQAEENGELHGKLE